MKIPFRQSILLSGIACAIAGSSYAVADALSDARQESQIWTSYALSPYLRTNDLKVSVQNGKATLSGTVEEDVNKDLAKEIALGVKGITDVDNQIMVKPDYTPPKKDSEYSFADSVSDSGITTAVKSKLLWSKHADGTSTRVETREGRVTLHGTVESTAAKELAGRLAINTNGVVSVDNQMKVDTKKPSLSESGKSTLSDTGQDIADSWITTKVKSTFMYSSNIDASDIKVTTAKGMVTLVGKVNNGAEQALAIELAQNVRGVKGVHSKELVF